MMTMSFAILIYANNALEVKDIAGETFEVTFEPSPRGIIIDDA